MNKQPQTRPQVSIRFGASNDDITVDGVTFVRGALDRAQRTFLSNVVVGALIKSGALPADTATKPVRHRRRRQPRKGAAA